MPTDQATKDSVLSFLRKAGGPVSEGDVAAGAGLDVGTAKSTLYQLMLGYTCALEVRDDGTLVYDFGRKLAPLNKPTWGDRLRTVARWLWKGFSVVYKASLAVVLLLYAVVFVVLIIAAAVAASAATEDDGPADGAFSLVGAIFRGIFNFGTYSALTYVEVDRYGYQHRHFEPRKPVLPQRNPEAHPKSFIASVYDFVLGPKRVEVDARAQTRELASFVRETGGALSIADVQALSGLTRVDAEQLFARFVAEFDGETEITDEGALYAQFPELQRSSSTEHDEPIIYYWDEYEAPFEVTGNSTGKNLCIAAVAAFNLVCSAYILMGGGGFGAFGVLLGAVPAVMFSLFFAIPAVRAVWVYKQNKLQHEHNIRKRLFGAIFGVISRGGDTSMSIGAIAAIANVHVGDEETLDPEQLRPLFELTMREIGGAVDLDEQEDLVVDLTSLRNETAAREDHWVHVKRAAVAYSTLD